MKRLIWPASIVLVLLAGALLVVSGATRTVIRRPAGVSTPNEGVAHYAIGTASAGFKVIVDSVQRQIALPAALPSTAGVEGVMVHLRFENDSQAQQRADPHDFHLREDLGQQHPPIFAAQTSCQEWPMTDLVPPAKESHTQRDAGAQRAGSRFGPVTLCFQAGSAPQAALTLIWDPDVSMPILDSPTEIALK